MKDQCFAYHFHLQMLTLLKNYNKLLWITANKSGIFKEQKVNKKRKFK